jgi:hypothetical protein
LVPSLTAGLPVPGWPAGKLTTAVPGAKFLAEKFPPEDAQPATSAAPASASAAAARGRVYPRCFMPRATLIGPALMLLILQLTLQYATMMPHALFVVKGGAEQRFGL